MELRFGWNWNETYCSWSGIVEIFVEFSGMKISDEVIEFPWDPLKVGRGREGLLGVEHRRNATYLISSKLGKTYMCLKLSIANKGRSCRDNQFTPTR